MFRSSLILPVVFVSLAFLRAAYADEAGISYNADLGGVRLISKKDLGGDVVSQFVVRAVGADAVAKEAGNLTGVLFQATARPDPAIKAMPIKLSYKLAGQHDAVLTATIGDRRVVSDSPAWVWAVAAKFADHRATGALTLIDAPQTPAEKRFQRRWQTKHGSDQRLVWARYHPEVDDTLVGFFLMMADAMMGDAEHIRTMTSGLRGFDDTCGYSLALDETKSRRAATTLDGIIRLESRPGDCVMLNDVGEQIVFRISNDRLQVRGAPDYRFSRKNDTGGFREVRELTAVVASNEHLFVDANPALYKIVNDFAGLVAFFNYVDEHAPDHLDAFVGSLKPVMRRVPTINTPIAVPLSLR